MQWASALSSQTDLRTAMTELKRELARQLGSARPDLVLAFASPHYAGQWHALPELVQGHLAPRTFAGCSAWSVLGGSREVEEEPALALVAAALPGVDIRPVRVAPEEHPDPDADPGAWVEALGVSPDPVPHFVLLADTQGPPPFDPRPLLAGLDFAYPQSTKIGGLASSPEGNALFLDDRIHRGGLVGLALQGNVAVDAIVAQGCRPIGPLFRVSRCRDYLLYELDERPALHVLAELFQSLPPEDRARLHVALHIGIASTELQTEYGQGDFLIRNILRIDEQQSCLLVGDHLREGQTVQFHLRDAEAASEDLQFMLDGYLAEAPPTRPAGALLFTCTGRGRHLFGCPDHDSSAFFAALGELPLGGFFCGGEIGPVGGTTHLHGYTSSFGVFRPVR